MSNMHSTSANHGEEIALATSSIGQAVVLDNKSADRLIQILKKPCKPVKVSGEPLKLSPANFGPKKLKWE